MRILTMGCYSIPPVKLIEGLPEWLKFGACIRHSVPNALNGIQVRYSVKMVATDEKKKEVGAMRRNLAPNYYTFTINIVHAV